MAVEVSGITSNFFSYESGNIPNGYMLRMTKDALRFLLLEYDPSSPAKIGVFNILKVQQKGKVRYLPFVIDMDSIT